MKKHEIEVRFINREFTEGMRNGPREVSEDTTIRDLIKICEHDSGFTIAPESFKWLMFLLDGKSADLDKAVGDAKTLHVMRILLGG